MIPILGLLSSPDYLSSLNTSLRRDHFDPAPNYTSHYKYITSLLRTISKTSNAARIRSLVVLTSECKDYGMIDELNGDEGLRQHTESPINSPLFAVQRANYATKTFEKEDSFCTILLKPTNVYGGSGSYYGEYFKLAAEAKKRGGASACYMVWNSTADAGVLELADNPRFIPHALRVDSCGEEHIALVEHPDRNLMKGQVLNVSLDEIAKALVIEYGIEGDVKYISASTD